MNFIPIQQQQGIYADGYEKTYICTGEELMISQRTSAIFATAAKQHGEVIEVTDRGIKVKYEDGSEHYAPLGIMHGTAAGVNYPHELVTTLKVGDRFKQGDAISFNTKYFVPDPIVKGMVSWKAGVMATVAFIDSLDTLEDGCVVSEDLAKKLNTQISTVKNITVRFDQVVDGLVKVGQSVEMDQILCVIKDPEIADDSLFDAASLDLLAKLSANTPKSKVNGVITKMECYYHGDIEDMSDSIKAIADRCNKERELEAKALGKPVFDGTVDAGFRSEGRGLDFNHMLIRLYIDHNVPFSSGDKAVICNQMKTVATSVMYGKNTLEDGRPLDIKFGNTSVEERMVNSPRLICSFSLLARVLSERTVAVYKGRIKSVTERL